MVNAVLAAVLAVQTASASALPSPPPRPGPVVSVTVGVVQVDAVVTDTKGRHVTDLAPGDFIVKEAGAVREVSHVAYVAVGPPGPTPQVVTVPGATPPSRAALAARPRLITLVVDDLNLSFESTIRLKDALRQLVQETLAPTDQVAIVRTGGGVGTMQQFTSDRRLLSAAIDRVRFNPLGVGRITSTEPIDTEMPFGGGPAGGSPSGRDRKEAERQADVRRAQFIAVGSLGTLRAVVRSLAPLAGRKAVVFFSDGLSADLADDERRVEGSTTSIIDEANRASVALYTIDTRGLFHTGLRADDNLASSTSPSESSRLLARRGSEDLVSRMGLRDLARRTGGFPVTGTNDLRGAVETVIADQQGYYLIGYVPPPSALESAGARPRFHELQVSVRRPGLRVRARSGFYGVRDADAPPPSTPAERLRAALLSPFAAADLALRLQGVFLDDEKAGPSLRALLHLDAREVTFTESEDGGRRASLEVVAVTFGESGQPVDQKSQTFHVRGPAGDVPSQDLALFYSVDLPIRRPGAYQFRVVVRDVASDRLGAASQFVEVPDVSKGHLALSGIIVRAAGDHRGAPGAAETLVGRVRPGRTVEYVFQILNARRDARTGTSLTTQARLWRERELLYEGPPALLVAENSDPRRIAAAGRLNLSPRLPPGDYVLEVTVADRLAKRGRNVATESVDLEVVPE